MVNKIFDKKCKPTEKKRKEVDMIMITHPRPWIVVLGTTRAKIFFHSVKKYVAYAEQSKENRCYHPDISRLHWSFKRAFLMANKVFCSWPPYMLPLTVFVTHSLPRSQLQDEINVYEWFNVPIEWHAVKDWFRVRWGPGWGGGFTMASMLRVEKCNRMNYR